MTLALFPLGVALAWTARAALIDAHAAVVDDNYQDGQVAARAIESLMARNGLALRIAANAALRSDPIKPCEAMARSLALTPAVASRFSVRNTMGDLICINGDYRPSNVLAPVAPGNFLMWVDPDNQSIRYRVGVNGGMATGELTRAELTKAVRDLSLNLDSLSISDGHLTLDVISHSPHGASRPIRRCSIGWRCSCHC